MTAIFTRFLGIMPAALALNALNPSTASAQDRANTDDKVAAGAFNPLNLSKKGQYAGVYTGFATGVTERNDEANHSSIPLEIPEKREKACANDGDVCADISKFAKTYVADFTEYVDAIKAEKKGSEEAKFRGTPFPIPPKESEEKKDTLFSNDLRCYLEIYKAMDEMDGAADGIVHGIALTKILAKNSPERKKLGAADKCDVDYFGRKDDELSREIYFTTAAPLFAGLTKVAYEGPNSMVQGYAPQEELDELQGKLNKANEENEKNKKEIGDLQNARDAAEAKIRKYKEIGKYSMIGLGGALVLGLLIALGVRSRKNRTTPPVKTKPAPQPANASSSAASSANEPKPASKPPASPSASPSAAAPSAPAPVSAPPPPAVDDDLDDVLADLAAAKGNQTPASGAAPLAPTAVTAENVIIEGPDAAPVAGIDPDVIRAQILAICEGFVATFQPKDGESLLKDGAGRVVDEFTDRIIVEYNEYMASQEHARRLAEFWKAQLQDRGYIVRRGLPEKVLMSMAAAYKNEVSPENFGSDLRISDELTTRQSLVYAMQYLKRPSK